MGKDLLCTFPLLGSLPKVLFSPKSQPKTGPKDSQAGWAQIWRQREENEPTSLFIEELRVEGVLYHETLTSVVGVVMHACHPSTGETEAGVHKFEASQGCVARACQTKHKINNNKYFSKA